MAAPQQQSQPQPAQESSMRLAEILSDLVSLRVCDPSAALALVSVRPSSQDTPATTTSARTEKGEEESGVEHESDDVDLKRAKELLRLHYEVKSAHKRGLLSRGLEDARRKVDRALGG